MDTGAVDVHAHYLSPRCVDLGAHDPDPAFSGRCMDLDERAEWMGKANIELQILAPELRYVAPFLGTDQETRWARRVNDAVAADIEFRNEFAAAALLPLMDGATAALELVRAKQELGHCAGLVHSRPPGGMAADHLEPLWAAASRLGVPLILHSLASPSDERLQRFDLDVAMGRNHDVGLAAAELILGRVLDHFPELKIVLVTGGGSLPYLVARLDRDHELRTDARSPANPPSEYMSRLYFDSSVYGGEQLNLLIDSAGAGRVMIASDWPMSLFDDDPVGFLIRSCSQRLDDKELGDVMAGTAKELFSL